jgi:hypothetical protein
LQIESKQQQTLLNQCTLDSSSVATSTGVAWAHLTQWRALQAIFVLISGLNWLNQLRQPGNGSTSTAAYPNFSFSPEHDDLMTSSTGTSGTVKHTRRFLIVQHAQSFNHRHQQNQLHFKFCTHLNKRLAAAQTCFVYCCVAQCHQQSALEAVLVHNPEHTKDNNQML